MVTTANWFKLLPGKLLLQLILVCTQQNLCADANFISTLSHLVISLQYTYTEVIDS